MPPKKASAKKATTSKKSAKAVKEESDNDSGSGSDGEEEVEVKRGTKRKTATAKPKASSKKKSVPKKASKKEESEEDDEEAEAASMDESEDEDEAPAKKGKAKPKAKAKTKAKAKAKAKSKSKKAEPSSDEESSGSDNDDNEEEEKPKKAAKTAAAKKAPKAKAKSKSKAKTKASKKASAGSDDDHNAKDSGDEKESKEVPKLREDQPMSDKAKEDRKELEALQVKLAALEIKIHDAEAAKDGDAWETARSNWLTASNQYDELCRKGLKEFDSTFDKAYFDEKEGKEDKETQAIFDELWKQDKVIKLAFQSGVDHFVGDVFTVLAYQPQKWWSSDAKYTKAVSPEEPAENLAGSILRVAGWGDLEVKKVFSNRFIHWHIKTSDNTLLQGSNIYVSVRANSAHGTDVALVHDIGVPSSSPLLHHWIAAFEKKIPALAYSPFTPLSAAASAAAIATANDYKVSDIDVKTISTRARFAPTKAVYYDPNAWRHEEPPILPEDIEEERRLVEEVKLPLLKSLPNGGAAAAPAV